VRPRLKELAVRFVRRRGVLVRRRLRRAPAPPPPPGPGPGPGPSPSPSTFAGPSRGPATASAT